MRPTSILGLAGLAIVGIILADVLMSPSGTTHAANGMATIIDPTYNALLGRTTAPPGGQVGPGGGSG
jgi:hypothetical protein